MLTRWRKVWTDLWVNKTRTLLMVSTIIVGVFSIGLVNNLAIMMNNDMESDYLSSNPSHAKIYVSPINDDWVRNLRDIPGVADTEGRIQLSGKWTNPEGKRITILFSTVKSIDKMRLDQLKPAESGGLIPELRRQDVLFDRSAKALGFKPGDSIVIEIPGGEKRSLHFVDYVHDVTTIPYNMSDVITGYVNQETADYFGSEKDYNQLLVSVSENTTDRVHVSNVIKKITDRMEDNGIKVTGVSMYGVGHHFAWEITQGVIFILTFFGWMTIVLSGFLIINTIIALMLQQTRQVGIMKAIGAGAEQIFPMYLALLICFGGAAFIISFPLAAWASSLMGKFMADFLNYDAVSTGFFPNVILLQAVVAILTPILAAMLPVINSLRVPVREALNSYGLGGSSQKITQAESRLSFIPRPILLSLRNAFRKKTRLALTLCTLIMAGGIFIAVFNLWISFDQLMQDIQGYFLADINVVLTHNYPAKSIKSVVQAFPGVESVEGWMSMNGVILAPDRIKEDAISFIAPPSDSKLIRPSMVEGRWLQPGDKNVIVAGNQLQKIRPDLKLNDWVEIKINNKRSKWQIIGFYRLPGNIDPPLLYTNYEYLSYLVGMPNQVAELRFTTYEHDAASQSNISRELQSHLKKNKIDVIYLQTASEWFQQQKSQTDVLAYIMLMMACLIAVVGGLGLTNTMSLNVMERTREIGVMRAIGATNSNIQYIVVVEAIVIGLISWVLGIGLSIPITYLLDYGVGIAIFQSPLNVTFSWTGSFAWLLGMLLITTLSSIAPAARASKLSVRETLAYE